MKPIIFTSYEDLLDKENAEILLDTLQEMKNNGATIYLATDSDTGEAYLHKIALLERGYDFISNIISIDEFSRGKVNPYYWTSIRVLFHIEAEDIILLDANLQILENAKKNGVHTLSSGTYEEAAEELKVTYEKLCNR